jgi:hypothetical protein
MIDIFGSGVDRSNFLKYVEYVPQSTYQVLEYCMWTVDEIHDIIHQQATLC